MSIGIYNWPTITNILAERGMSAVWGVTSATEAEQAKQVQLAEERKARMTELNSQARGVMSDLEENEGKMEAIRASLRARGERIGLIVDMRA